MIIKLHVSTSNSTIGSMLAQKDKNDVEEQSINLGKSWMMVKLDIVQYKSYVFVFTFHVLIWNII